MGIKIVETDGFSSFGGGVGGDDPAPFLPQAPPTPGLTSPGLVTAVINEVVKLNSPHLFLFLFNLQPPTPKCFMKLIYYNYANRL